MLATPTGLLLPRSHALSQLVFYRPSYFRLFVNLFYWTGALELLDIAGAIITIDAMGDQTEIVRLIRQKKADYVLALKSNYSTLYNQVKDWFETAKTQEFMGIEISYDSRNKKGHHTALPDVMRYNRID